MSHPPKRTAGSGFVRFSKEDVEQSIPARFEQQVRLFPERIAVEDSTSSLTYRELNRFANRIARAILSARGAGSEPVALLLENGVALVAAMLGVLKAGKFYIAIDAAQPRARSGLILEETRPALLLADERRMQQAEVLRAELGFAGVPLLNIDTIDTLDVDTLDALEDTLEPGFSEEKPYRAIDADDLAYVVFTSGSTGRPKGVMQDHRYVLHLAMVYTNSGRISPADRLALLYSASFAGAVRDIYCALLNGAALSIFDVKREGLASLAAWLRRRRITVFFAVATMFRHFCRLLTPDDRFPTVRLIELGSETVYAGDVHLYQRHFPDDCRIIVNFGGSEISPICQLPVDAGTRIEGSVVPAGYPADDVELQLLDADGKPAAAGEPGEIVVRSSYLSRGYWNHPELTEAAFPPDPESGDRRLFRTGDVGRLAPDGCLLHLGRRDFQVKIRGYRVEIAEVEAFFSGIKLLRDAAVTAWSDETGERNLAAWVVPACPEAPPSIGELRALAKATLPEYMIPTRFILVDSLPTMENGKLDRRALSAPHLIREQSTARFHEPRTAVELRLKEIWSELLGKKEIGADENFFDLGGHSLLAMQAASRIAAAFRVTLHSSSLFETPTIAQLAEAVERARRMEPDEAIRPIPRGGEAPLSPAQQRLWVLAQIATAGEIYTMVRVFRLEGVLDMRALENALIEIGRRHDNLRAAFPISSPISNGVPVQAIAPDCANVFSFVDLRETPDDRRGAALNSLLAEANNRRWDLATPPLWKVLAIRLAANRHILHLAMHHMISDDWSVQVLLRELSSRYDALLAGQQDPAPELAVHYADYAAWQRRRLTGERLAQQLAYWREQLQGAPPSVELPLDRPRQASADFTGGAVRLHLDADLAARLGRLSRESETTLFVTLLAAYAVLLSRYGNPDDIVIGTPLANRHPVETEALIGFFVNTLALRLRWREGATFREIQACAHRAAVGGFAHSDVPFDHIVEALHTDRSPLHGPVFQTMFTLQNAPRQELALRGLAVTAVEQERPTAGAAFDLTLSLRETGGELCGALEFNAALFDHATIASMAAHFETLLRSIVQSPDAAVASLPGATKERGIKSVGAPPQEPRCLHDWFDEQAARTPRADAVTCAGASRSYDCLRRESNRLGHRLQALGVRPGTLVGMCAEPSPEMAAGILGILKAGGACVPMDPVDPRERLAAIARDAGLRIVITQGALTAAVPSCEHVIRLDADDAAWQPDEFDDVRRSSVAPDALAYVSYTSDSAGQPRGVMITHRNLSRLFTATHHWFRFDARDVWTWSHPCTLDRSMWELWGALLYGGRLVAVPRAVSRDPEAFCRLLAEERVTVLNQTPSEFYPLMRLQRGDELSRQSLNLRMVVLSGETLDPRKLRTWFERHGDRELRMVTMAMMFGAAETTEHAAYRHLTIADTFSTRNLIGSPIPDLEMHVLDRHREPAPAEVPGELYVGGAGVARGYLGRPEPTAERFVANPFSSDPAARLYRTGDLARRLTNGDLELLGRTDNQVMIRGRRVELGEIEDVLAGHPAVEDAAVVLSREDEGDARLVAYLTPRRNADLSTPQQLITDVQRQARQRLPEYMIPSAFVLLDALPLTADGKLDHDALPAPFAA